MLPVLSVVVPTRNRCSSLHRLLRAIASDSTAPPLEVIVVDDGSTDATRTSLEHVTLPFALSVITQSSMGPARARNVGAGAARGDVLLFLDDDVEPQPGTLRAHVTAHTGSDDSVGIGDLPPVADDQSFFGIILRGWWTMMLDDIRKPGHRFSFRNVLTGHLSIRRDRFERLGGFDASLLCHEDWEFGYRAMKAGMRLRFIAGAVAMHHDTSDLAKACRRKFDEGVADVQLARLHPELTIALPLSWPPTSRKGRIMRRLAWWPLAGKAMTRVMPAAISMYEQVRMRGRWRATLELLLTYWYWSGVASLIPDRLAVKSLVPQAAAAAPEVIIDLRDGIEHAERQLDRMNPASAALFYGSRLVAQIPATPGLERLRGEHLRPLLAGKLRDAFRRALQQERAVPRLLQPLAASPGASGSMTNAHSPVVGDVHLPADVGAGVDMKHRSTVPPVHDVA